MSSAIFLFTAALASPNGTAHAADETEPALRVAVEADWRGQEKRLGRTIDSPTAISAALDRAERLLVDLRTVSGVGELESTGAALESARIQAAGVDSLDETVRSALYLKVRWLTRDLALRNPLVSSRPILFLQRRRYVCQMLHEYLAYYYDEISGGGVCILEKPGRSMAIRELTGSRLPEGAYTTLSLSYDAKTIYFAFAERAAEKPPLCMPKAGARYFHIFAMDVDGSNLRQLSDDRYDDFDPCPLPDGGIAFMSTRRGGGFGRCHNPWEPLPAYTLHRMDADGSNIRTLSFHETNEWHPTVLSDGRIAYIRWDYVDRGAANFHGIWVSNPDGTNPAILFGNYTTRINACYQPHAIPGSRRIVFVAGAHHADVGGSLLMLDPDRMRQDSRSGEDDLRAVESLTPDVAFPEAPGWPKSYFHSPWPLSENYFLVSFGPGQLPGMSSGGKEDCTGIYYFDRFGNLELLYRDRAIPCMYPIPLAARPAPPVITSALDKSLGDEGEYMLTDVRQGLLPLPSDRPIRELRIWQVLPKTTHVANQPRIGHANAESARMLLGSVPVETDGSAYFRAPARKPIYFQAVDENGRAVQTMRSVSYLQPGERRGCIGCHEPSGSAAIARQTLAIRRGPSIIRPGPDGTRPMSYPRLVQPILDRTCMNCHDGRTGAPHSKLVLSGAPTEDFTKSYEALRPFVRWQEWGDESIDGTVTRPGHGGADASRIWSILRDEHHAENVKLSAEDRLCLNIWLDGNVPFYGTYDKDQMAAQKRGEIVPEPKVQ